MAREITIHLVAAVPGKRVPLRAGSVHLYRRNRLGDARVDSRGRTCETITTINNLKGQGDNFSLKQVNENCRPGLGSGPARRTQMRLFRIALGSFLIVTVFASVSQAQVQRTFVSGSGSDGNPCSRTSPCRTFTQALSVTNPGGEVIALDSAGYGAFIVTQAVTIQAPNGVYAGVTV